MFASLKKRLGFSSTTSAAPVAVVQAAHVAEVIPAPKPVPVFLLPETAGEYLSRLTAAEEVREAKRLAILRENKEFEAQASELEERDASPAQRELNRRNAARLREQAKVWRFPFSVNEHELVRQVREEEARKILSSGQLLHRESGEDVYQWCDPCHARGGRVVTPTERSVVRYGGRTFLVAVRQDGKVWATDSVAQMTNEELKAIA